MDLRGTRSGSGRTQARRGRNAPSRRGRSAPGGGGGKAADGCGAETAKHHARARAGCYLRLRRAQPQRRVRERGRLLFRAAHLDVRPHDIARRRRARDLEQHPEQRIGHGPGVLHVAGSRRHLVPALRADGHREGPQGVGRGNGLLQEQRLADRALSGLRA